VAVALDAMATRFEIVLHGENPVGLRAAGEEALAEIQRLEARLSLYRPDSEIARVNARAAREPVRVTPEVFALLRHARQLSDETGGAFDITIGPLMRCWGFMGAGGERPSPEAIAAARECVGMHHLVLDAQDFTVRFAREGVMLDLGAIGKGFAVEQAADFLREAGVTSALLHSGTSTAYAIGNPPDADCWKVAIDRPQSGTGVPPVRGATTQVCGMKPPHEPPRQPATRDRRDACPTLLTTVGLKDEALSVSAIWGKSFEADGEVYGHEIDPRTGWPTDAAVLAAVATASATESDAFSTALITVGLAGHDAIARLRPGMRTVVAEQTADGLRIAANGLIG
jgi:thiamine biosynthesis lipoprotein